MNRRSALLSLAGTALAATTAPTASRAQDARTITLTDDRGVPVAAPLAPRRVASVSYVPVDIALALGTRPVATTYMVQGRHPDYLLGLTKDMKQLGQRARPSLELLAEARPDVTVAVRRYTEGNAARYAAIAPYLAYNVELFGDSDRTINQVASLLGKPERGRELNAQFRKDLTEFSARVPKDRRVRFQIMWDGDNPYTFYSEHMAAAIGIALGGDNIAGPNPTPHLPEKFGFEISLETMLAKDPEVIFVCDYGPARPQEANPIWSMISAVRNRRVHYVGDHWAEVHGPVARQVVLREAAHLLHPDRFPRPDIRAEAEKLIPAAVR